ncbi:thiolase-like protein [Ensifer adhaerens]|nr:thiolase-like protein [Ensifer adhaerens]
MKAQLADEIIPVEVSHAVKAPSDGSVVYRALTVQCDEGPRQSSFEVLQSLKPALPDGRHITAGNASQLSDGEAALVLMDASLAAQRELEPLGLFRGAVVTGCAPEKMDIRPVLAIPKQLNRFGLATEKIDLWGINEAFASQLLACTDALGIPIDRLNVNGGAIANGHDRRPLSWPCPA